MTDDLENDTTDELVAIANAIFGTLPIIGTVISEIFKYVIPNQRVDRIASLLRKIDNKVSELSTEIIEIKMAQSNYIDLLEDCMWATTRALSEERIEYIANVFANGIKDNEANIINHKKLLNILNQLDDIDLIFMKSYVLTTWNSQQRYEYYEKNASLLNEPLILANDNGTQQDLHEHFLNHKRTLYKLGLIQIQEGKQALNNIAQNNLDNIEATWLANLLLQEINILPEDILNKLYGKNESKK